MLYLVNININKRFFHKIKEVLSTNLDWRYVIGRAIHYNVFSMFSKNLSFLATTDLGNLIPQKVLEIVRELNYSFLGQSIIIYEESRKIFTSLVDKGIEFTPLKGVLLAETVYPERHSRFFRDIDLLFPNVSEMRNAEKELIKLGYEFIATNSRASTFRKYKHGIIIDCDLHRSFSLFHFHEYPRSRSLIEDIWRKSSKKNIGGVRVTVMNSDHMLLMLFQHSFRHGPFSLRDLCDAVQILRKDNKLDWQFISEKLEDFPCVFKLFVNVINCIGADILDTRFMTETSLKTITRSLESEKLSLEKLQNPIYYINFCPFSAQKCVYKARFPAIPKRQIHKKILKYIYEYYFIITLARRAYGSKYALKCLLQEFVTPLGWLLGKLMKILGKEASMLGIQELFWLE